MVISVIIPLYYGSKYIKSKIKMIEKAFKIANILNEAEIIFVNDSPDEKISLYDIEYKVDVKVISNERNYGIHYSRALGLSYSKAKYIHFLDQDDYILEDFYEKTLNSIKDNDVLVSNCILEKNNDEKRILYRNKIELNNVKRPYLYIFLDDRIISPGQCIIKRESIPLFWTKNIMQQNGSDDFLLWLLMFEENKRFSVIKDVLYIHKNTGENFSLNEKKMLKSLEEVTYILSKYDKSRFYKFMKAKVSFLKGKKSGLSFLFFVLMKLRLLRIKLFEK